MTRYGMCGLMSVLSLAVPASPAPAGEVDTLLRAIPGDIPLTIVVKNLDEFDRNVLGVVGRFDPRKASHGFVEDLKAKIPFGDWIDVTKPIALCQVSTDSPDESMTLVVVPGFDEKIHNAENAVRMGDVWEVASGGLTVFVRSRGSYVAVAPTRTALDALDSKSPPLIAKLGEHGSLLTRHDAFMHFDLHTVRDFLVGAVGEAGPLAPQLGAKLNEQLGVDAAAATGVVGMIIDAVDTFLQQASVIDLAMSADAESIDATMFVTFEEGPIRKYLGRQRPGTATALREVPDRPFVVAGGYDFAGEESKFLDFVFERSSAAAGLSGDPVRTEAFRASSRLDHDLFERIGRGGFALTVSGLRMNMIGYYAGRNNAALFDAAKKAAGHRAGPSADAGVTPPLRRFGDVEVHEFSLAPDPSRPQAVFLSPLYGPDTRYAIAQREGRVDYAVGNAGFIEKHFGTRSTTSLADNVNVGATLAKLPARSNLSLLIDPSGLVPLVGPFLGIAAPPAAQPMSPIGIVATLSEHPARIDIRVPVKTITRLAPAQP